MSDTVSETSNTTVDNEPVPFDTIIENLSKAADDAMATDDYITYSTLLDVYFSDVDNYSYEEREQLLEELLKVLKENQALTYEIGWDIPSLIINYIDSEFDFQSSLRTSPCCYKVIKIFEALANYGNPKELFLKCCELMTTISIHEIDTTDDYHVREKFLDLKLYCLLELVASSLKKIETLHPSRFLAMFVTSMINFIYLNFNNFESHNLQFLLKRVYSFSRNYDSLPTPSSEKLKDYSAKDLAKIKEDEDYLQRKLLLSLISDSVYHMGQNWSPNSSVSLFQKISDKEISNAVDTTVLDRFHELCLSYDIDFNEIKSNFLISTSALFHKFKFDQVSEDELTGIIFETIVKDFQENLSSSITDAKQIKINNLGLLIYHTNYFKNNYPAPCNITLKDSILTTIRLVVPMMVESTFKNKSLQDLCISWNWITLQTSLNDIKINGVKLQVSAIPSVLLKTYFNCLLFIITNNFDNWYKDFRFVVLTLLTKMLTLCPEQIGYDFVRDAIIDCPYNNVKSALVGVLKELLTKDKITDEENIDDLSNKLNAVELDKTKSDSTKLNHEKPPLPNRDIKKSPKFFSLSNERFLDILSIVEQTSNNCFVEINNDTDSDTEVETEFKSHKINYQYLSTLSALLNLLVVLRNNEYFINNKSKVDSFSKSLTRVLNDIKKQYKDSVNDVRVAEMLLLTLDRI